MNGKSVNDINREIDKFLSVLWLTLQNSHLDLSLFFMSPEQRVVTNYISLNKLLSLQNRVDDAEAIAQQNREEGL